MLVLRQELALLLTVLVCSLAAYTDLRRGIIPNRLVLIYAAVSCAMHGALAALDSPSAALSALGYCLLGMLFCAIFPCLLYALKSLGGGDLKLLIAIGACLGPQLGFQLQAYAYVLGSLYALVRVVYRGTLWKTTVASAASVMNPLLPRSLKKSAPVEALSTMHFAPAVCASALLTIVLQWGLR
ncbi:MAG: A24 family peptidase [Polyangiales bacterium]